MTPVEIQRSTSIKGFVVGCLTCQEKKIVKPLYISENRTQAEAMSAMAHANSHNHIHPEHVILVIEGQTKNGR